MPSLVDIPAIVNTLVTFFALNGTDDEAIEAIRNLMVKGAIKLDELKDELLEQSELRRSVEWFQQNPLDVSAKTELEHCLTETLKQHHLFRESDADSGSARGNMFANPEPAAKLQKSLPVEFLALAAQGNVSGSACIVDIWACAPDQTEEVRRKAALTGLDAVMGMKAGLSIAAASLLTVSLEIQGMEVLDNIAVIHWQGEAANAAFIVSVPQQTKPGRYPGKATISCAGIPVATIVFLFPVCADESTIVAESVGTTHYPRSAFASYASENRADVMERIQGMQVVAPDLDIFLDVLSLRSGQRWLDELEKSINGRDVFYLFWSQQAAESEWVEKEWRLALAKRGLDYINPVPLDEPDSVPPPTELAGLHFNDAWLGYIKYQTMKTGSPTVSVI